MALKSKKQKIKLNVFEKMYFCFFSILPFIYIEKTIDPVLIPRQIYLTCFVLVILLILLFTGLKKNTNAYFSFLRLSLPILLFSFLLVNVISFTQTTVLTESIYVVSKYCIEIIFFMLTTYLLIQHKIDKSILIKSILVFCIISVLIALYQVFTLDFTENFRKNSYQINSSYGNKNLFSSILFLSIPFIASGIFLSKKWKIASLILTVCIASLLIYIQTRAVLIACFLSVAVYIVLQKKHLFSRNKSKLVIPSIILLVILGFLFFTQSSYLNNLTDSRSVSERLLIWSNSLHMARDNFFLGVGSGNWQFYFPKYGLDKFADSALQNGYVTFQRPHNDFLWIFCETGIFGLIIYIAVFATGIYYAYKLLKQSVKQEDKAFYSALIAIITGYILISFVDFPLERIEHQLVIYLIFSIITAGYYNRFKMPVPTFKLYQVSTLIPVFFTLALFSLTICLNRFSGESHTKQMYSFQNNSDWNQMITEADNSTNFCYSTDPTSMPIKWYKGVALFSQGNIGEAEKCFLQANSIHPYNIHILNNLASCYETLGNHKASEETYVKALVISTNFEEARLNLSAVYYNSKDFEKAFNVIDKVKVDKDCQEKYQTYLPAILYSWLEVITKKQKDPTSKKVLTDILNSKTKTMQYYLLSKRNNVSLEQSILNN